LYRAVDSVATIDFLLSAKRDAAAAERFLAKALGGENHPALRVINTDKHAAYPPAIAGLAWRTIAGYEAVHMIRKGQASGSALAPRVGLLHRFILGLFAATS
jgi:hypothetical protein